MMDGMTAGMGLWMVLFLVAAVGGDTRYAAGEIDDEEYARRLSMLSH